MIWLSTIIASLLIIALILIARLSRGNSREMDAREANTAKLRQRVRQIEELIRSWRRVSNNQHTGSRAVSSGPGDTGSHQRTRSR